MNEVFTKFGRDRAVGQHKLKSHNQTKTPSSHKNCLQTNRLLLSLLLWYYITLFFIYFFRITHFRGYDKSTVCPYYPNSFVSKFLSSCGSDFLFPPGSTAFQLVSCSTPETLPCELFLLSV